MDVPILSGGVVILVASALWLVYLVPSWVSRHRYQTTERDAVRLSQALRVLAETSENPQEMRLELDTRTAYQQAKLARRAEAERLQAAKLLARETAEHERALQREQAEAARERARVEAELTQERARASAMAERQALARERAAVARETAAARRAQTRRRARAMASVIGLVGLVGTGVGVWLLTVGAGPIALVAGVSLLMLSLLVQRRVSIVARRSMRRPVALPDAVAESPRAARPVVVVQDEPAPKWTPRQLPQPLSSVGGSVAASAQDRLDAREALRRAAQEEAARQRAAELAPVRIETVRPAASAAPSPFAGMGVVGDEEIEAHVRKLLASRRAS